MNQVLDELDKGQDVHAVDAALKRHEAISADVHAGVSGVCACVWGVCWCVLVCGVCACVWGVCLCVGCVLVSVSCIKPLTSVQ